MPLWKRNCETSVATAAAMKNLCWYQKNSEPERREGGKLSFRLIAFPAATLV